MWVVCPHALVVMFVRQAYHAYDSLGAADYPDLTVALLYCPFVGWVLTRAAKQAKLRSIGLRIALWHVAVIGAAVLAVQFRNKLWWASG